MTRLTSKVALISGGASGMGASHARAIAEAGGRVMIGDIQDDAGRAVADNIGAQARFTHLADLHGYTASKIAIRELTKSAALERGAHGVSVKSVHPGLVRTPMSAGVPESIVQSVFHRFAEPEEVSAVVVFLAGDDSRFSTGSELVVDGGETAGKETVRLSELRR